MQLKKIASLICLGVSLSVVVYLAYHQYIHTTAAGPDGIAVICEWARLASLPDTAADIQTKTEGNSFTRAFRVTFSLPEDDLEAWLQKSPGIQDAAITQLDEATFRYVIEPGGGATYAEVVLDRRANSVTIYAYWS